MIDGSQKGFDIYMDMVISQMFNNLFFENLIYQKVFPINVDKRKISSLLLAYMCNTWSVISVQTFENERRFSVRNLDSSFWRINSSYLKIQRMGRTFNNGPRPFLKVPRVRRLSPILNSRWQSNLKRNQSLLPFLYLHTHVMENFVLLMYVD